MEYTPNLSLKKPEYWDLADIEDINENMDVLDEEVKNKADKTQVLTNVPLNAKFTDTIYTHPTNHPPSIITQDTTNRFVSDSEKSVWNGKQDALGFTPVNTTDSRLSNARTPTTHSHAIGDLPVATSGTSNTTQVVRADDNRLSNARTPLSHSHTKSEVGLGNVDNTSDANKPVSTAQSTALGLKADKTQVLTNVPANAKFTDTVYTHPASHPASMITQDAGNRFVSDTEKATWNGKASLSSPTFTGTPKTTANTSYTTSQIRNVRLYSETETVPTLANGEIALIYSTAVMP